MGHSKGSRKRRRVEKQAVSQTNNHGDHEPSDWWFHFSRRLTGPLALLKEPGRFDSIFKMTRKTFNYICSLVSDNFMAKPTNFAYIDGTILAVEDQVAVALRRLSSGESLFNVGISFQINPSTVSQVTWRFVEAMEEKAINHLRWPNSEAEMESIKSKFEKICGLPNCCGAIDTTHIMMCLPCVDSSNDVWIDLEKNHSMVLQAIVDPEMRFRDIVTGWPGSLDDNLVLHNSAFFKLCEKGLRLNGQKMELLSKGSQIREYIIGDSGFPLLPWLLTPYQEQDLSEFKAEFNKRNSAARIVVHRALARLKETWKIVQGEMWRPDKHRLPRIILVCCLLHNITIDLEDELQSQMPLSHHQHDSSMYKQQFCDIIDGNGLILRDKLSEYLSEKLPP